MISNQIIRSSIPWTRALIRFGSTSTKESSSSQNKSTNKTSGKKSGSEYLAADMYDYTTFSYYDLEVSMVNFRRPQPSPYAPIKSPEAAAQKK